MENSQDTEAEFVRSLKSLSAKTCWGFVGGRGTGSRVTFDFGEKIPRQKAVPNPHLTQEQQNFVGEISLFVQDAAWRIDSQASVICSSTTWNDVTGPFGDGLRNLVDEHVISIEVSKPGFDLVIEFGNGFTLRVFCDQTNVEDEATNYSLYLRLPGKYFAVKRNSRVDCEGTGKA